MAQLRRPEVCFFSAWDFHLPSEGGCQLIESNDNGSGFLFAAITNARCHDAAGLGRERQIAAPARLPAVSRSIPQAPSAAWPRTSPRHQICPSGCRSSLRRLISINGLRHGHHNLTKQRRESLFMRRLLFASAVAVLAAAGSNTAAAQDYPYCLQGRTWGYPGNCQFTSYAQCTATASGTDAYCGINPRFAFARHRRDNWRPY